jgi:hypothetical protein
MHAALHWLLQSRAIVSLGNQQLRGNYEDQLNYMAEVRFCDVPRAQLKANVPCELIEEDNNERPHVHILCI